MSTPAQISRRLFLASTSATALVACSGGTSSTATSTIPSTTPSAAGPPTSLSSSSAASSATTAGSAGPLDDVVALTAVDFDGLGSCPVIPEAAAGPFPNKSDLVRSDVTVGLPGHPMRLGLRVVDRECVPIPGAKVEIWHADATGDYSDYEDSGSGKDEGAGTTFCRGVQVADDLGIVDFQTLYPGWYEGRAVHIHPRVHVDGGEVLTSQIYFSDAYTESVYTVAPYDEFGSPDRTIANDGLAGNPAAEGTLLNLLPAKTGLGTGTVALLNLVART
jgi:protocatechuate 3,4-dioxygenase beta subunit